MRFRNSLLSRYLGCDDGLAAIEFAFIAPVMLTTYFGATEICNTLLADRKVTSVTAVTADLVAQSLQISDDDIEDIFTAASAIMEPYDLAALEIVVSSVVMEADGSTEVAWSDGFQAAARTPGSSYALPEGLITPGASLIVAEVRYTYATPFGEFVRDEITVSDRFLQRPRRVMKIIRNS